MRYTNDSNAAIREREREVVDDYTAQYKKEYVNHLALKFLLIISNKNNIHVLSIWESCLLSCHNEHVINIFSDWTFRLDARVKKVCEDCKQQINEGRAAACAKVALDKRKDFEKQMAKLEASQQTVCLKLHNCFYYLTLSHHDGFCSINCD